MQDGLVRIAIVVFLCAASGCAASRSGPTLVGSPDRTVQVADRSGTILQGRLGADDPTKTEELLVDFETAWARLPGVLRDIGLSVGTVDATTGTVSHQGERVRRIDGKRMSLYLECGSGTTAQPYADSHAVTVSYQVRLTKAGESTTAIQMRVDANARALDARGSPLRCGTRGRLEQLVFQRLRAAPAP